MPFKVRIKQVLPSPFRSWPGLNITQVEVMRRLRSLGEEDTSILKIELEQALMVSIGGIAAGLRNTG